MQNRAVFLLYHAPHNAGLQSHLCTMISGNPAQSHLLDPVLRHDAQPQLVAAASPARVAGAGAFRAEFSKTLALP